jgi:DNA-binding response OmpR family regulator
VRILLVDDDFRFAEVLSVALQKSNLHLHHAKRGADVVALATYDAVLLDLNLPDLDGLDLCRRIRSQSSVPIIILTARGGLNDKVKGLRRGADDYLVKPFSVVELLARLEAVLRRGRVAEPPGPVLGRLALDTGRHKAIVDGRDLELTRKEFYLLSALAGTSGAVVRKDLLMTQVWQTADPSAHRTVEVHVSSLRTKIKDAALIETVRGVGYRLVPHAAPRDGGEGE